MLSRDSRLGGEVRDQPPAAVNRLAELATKRRLAPSAWKRGHSERRSPHPLGHNSRWNGHNPDPDHGNPDSDCHEPSPFCDDPDSDHSNPALNHSNPALNHSNPATDCDDPAPDCDDPTPDCDDPTQDCDDLTPDCDDLAPDCDDPSLYFCCEPSRKGHDPRSDSGNPSPFDVNPSGFRDDPGRFPGHSCPLFRNSTRSARDNKLLSLGDDQGRPDGGGQAVENVGTQGSVSRQESTELLNRDSRLGGEVRDQPPAAVNRLAELQPLEKTSHN